MRLTRRRLPTMRKAMNGNGPIWYGGNAPTAESITASIADCLPGHLGMEFVGVGDDWLCLRMPVDQRTRQPFGRLHGGASVALAETVGSLGASRVVDHSRFLVVGMEINANHVRPAHDGWVYGTARAESIGRTTHVWSIRITDEADRLVCISRLTMAVISVERS